MNGSRKWIGIRLFIIVALVPVSHALGYPTGGLTTSAGHGLQLSLDSTWVDGAGYRPLRVMVKPVGTLRFERLLTLEFAPAAAQNGERSTTVVQSLLVPAGASGASITVPYPQSPGWSNVELKVYEDNRELDKLTTSFTPGSSWDEGQPTFLFVGSTAPDPSTLAQLFPQPQNQWGPTPVVPGAPPVLANSLALPSIASFPDRWIDYSSIDVVVLSWLDFQKLRDQRPTAWTALRHWVQSGGCLWVAGVTTDRLEPVDRALAASGTPWSEPKSADYGLNLNDASFARQAADAVAYGDGETEYVEGSGMARNLRSPAPPETVAVPEESPFQWRECGLGSVVALSDEQPFPGNQETWAWVLNTLGPERWLHFQRHGMSVVRDNNGFWNFLIPGVGLAPVNAFRGIITAFVLLIGPVNYYVLRSRRKLPWLVVTVPSCAAVVTVTMLIYAIASDGFTVRCRARSYTWIDQRHGGNVVTQSRLSYYAGLAPSAGLVFSPETAVNPLVSSPGSGDASRSRTLVWDERQRLSSGWLVSRRPTQFMTTRATTTKRHLQFHRRGDGSLDVENQLGGRLLCLVVSDADGKLYVADRPKAEKFIALPHESDTEVHAMLALLAATPLMYPPELEQFGIDQLDSGSRRYYGFVNSQIPAPDTLSSLLERRLMALTASLMLGKLEPRSYAAVVENPAELELGTDEAQTEASLHVVEGVW